jgi:uncharacterized protein (TIGR01777 family)
MNILIAGGTGLIGSALSDQLIQSGHSVTILSRNTNIPLPIKGVKIVQWDARTTEGWGHLVEGNDAIVNLTGENLGAGRWTAERKQRFKTSRIDSGKALAAAVRDANVLPDIFIQASAVGYYGPHQDEKLDETSPAGSDSLARLCMEWEAATAEVEEFGVRRAVIRTGVVLAKGGDILNKFLLQFRLFGGGPLGSGKQYLSWIHMHDEINAIKMLIESPASSGVYNLTAPQAVTNAEFGKTLAKIIKRPYWIPVPAFALKLALGEMSTMVLDGQRVLPAALMAAGYQFKYSALKPALEDLLA